MNQKPVFLLSFLPALAYWGLEYFYPPRIALLGGIVLAIIEIGGEKLFIGKIHRFSLLNFSLILFLGGLGVLAEDGVWFKLQPALSSVVMVGVLGVYKIKKRSLMFEIITDLQSKTPLPEKFYHQFEKHLAFFFIFHSVLMTFVALKTETGVWLFWKTAGFYILIAVFLVVEIFLFRFRGLR
ncbi:MAG TPA: septation protein IspZ [Bacteriovoracaceae bacterium]|nr:septation protein IspZ [Bacteriovoracaceae bacterium]